MTEEFGELLAAVTEGTKYRISPDDEKCFISELEHRVRSVMYTLWMDSQSNKLAAFLEHKKAEYFEDLYEFSYGITLYDEMDGRTSRKADTLAVMIIEKKDSYNKRIEGARLCYKRFNEMCGRLSHEDRETFISYFHDLRKIDYETLRKAIIRNLKMIENYIQSEEESLQ